MFALVADVEKYPQFVPMCESLTVRSRKERDGVTVLVADMGVGYKAIRETFTSQVVLKPDVLASDVKFHIDYEFKNRILSAMMGAVFDRAFRMFSSAFEERAKQVYGQPDSGLSGTVRAG